MILFLIQRNLELRPAFVISGMIFVGLFANTWFLSFYNALCHQLVVFTKEMVRIREVLMETVGLYGEEIFRQILVRTTSDL